MKEFWKTGESLHNLAPPSIFVSSQLQVPQSLILSFLLPLIPALLGSPSRSTLLPESQLHGVPRLWELVFPETRPQPPIFIPKSVSRGEGPLAFSPANMKSFPVAYGGAGGLQVQTFRPGWCPCARWLPSCRSELGHRCTDTAPCATGACSSQPPVLPSSQPMEGRQRLSQELTEEAVFFGSAFSPSGKASPGDRRAKTKAKASKKCSH